LPPASHPRVHKGGVIGTAHVRAQAKSLSHAWPIRLDQNISRLDQSTHNIDGLGSLQIEGDGPTAAHQAHCPFAEPSRTADPVDPDNIRPKIGQQHYTVRTWSQAGEFHDPYAVQRLRCHSYSYQLRGARLTY
jgi:hypothetical protein